jgi:hypothetical protein
MHTTASDGTCSVADRVRQASERGLDAIAVTDHDCFSASLSGRVDTRDGVEVISGVECRGDVVNTKVEILGYYVDPDHPSLSDVLSTARSYRRERNREMVAALADETGLDLDYESLRADADGMLGRPHMAAVLVESGLVTSIGDAFDQYLGSDGPAYVEMERVPANEVIAAIQDAGGVASLAHPGRIRAEDVPGIVSSLAEGGLDGIEVWYPYAESVSEEYADFGVEDAARLAGKHGLVKTGGSDCHGSDSGKYRIGEVRVDVTHLEALRDLATDRRPL